MIKPRISESNEQRALRAKESKRIQRIYFKGQKDNTALLEEIYSMKIFSEADFKVLEYAMKNISSEIPKVIFIYHGGGIRNVNRRSSKYSLDKIDEHVNELDKILNKFDEIKDLYEKFRAWLSPIDNLDTERNLFNFVTKEFQIYNTYKKRIEELEKLSKEFLLPVCTPLQTNKMIILKHNKAIEVINFPNIDHAFIGKVLCNYFKSKPEIFPRRFSWISIPSYINHKLGEAVVYSGRFTETKSRYLLLKTNGDWQLQEKEYL
jgi:hypothetical protein